MTPELKESLKIEYKVADVSNEEQVKALVAHVESWGGVDVMFNNAGIMHPADDNVLNTENKIWDLTQAINVKGVFTVASMPLALFLLMEKLRLLSSTLVPLWLSWALLLLKLPILLLRVLFWP